MGDHRQSTLHTSQKPRDLSSPSRVCHDGHHYTTASRFCPRVRENKIERKKERKPLFFLFSPSLPNYACYNRSGGTKLFRTSYFIGPGYQEALFFSGLASLFLCSVLKALSCP